MSNGDDVLDNWEEIDEAGLTNTFEKIQAEGKTLQQDKTINLAASASDDRAYSSATTGFPTMKLLQRTPSQGGNSSASSSAAVTSPLDDMASTFQPVMMVLHKSDDDYQSTNYVQPLNTQTVKILRRPTQSSEPRNNGVRPAKPIKTLQQREQEYAEARLRIMGSAIPEQDARSSNANNTLNSVLPTAMITANSVDANLASKTSPTTSKSQLGGQFGAYNNHYFQTPPKPLAQPLMNQHPMNYYIMSQPVPAYNTRTQPMQPMQQIQQQTWSPVVGGSVSSTSLLRNSPSQQRMQQEPVLRLPRGPDGSSGFGMRR